MLWAVLVQNIQIARVDRCNAEKAEEFKEFNLKMKAWTVLMKYFNPGETRFYSNSLLDLSNSQVQENNVATNSNCNPVPSIYDLAELKRMAVLFSALRYGIKERARSLIANETSYKHQYLTYLSKGFISLKMLIKRKRKCRQRALRLRKIHLQNLVVKSFSAILFNAQQKVKGREMTQVAIKVERRFLIKRFLGKWIQRKEDRVRACVQI